MLLPFINFIYYSSNCISVNESVIILCLDDLYLLDGDANMWSSVLRFSLSIALNESFSIPVALIVLSKAPWLLLLLLL